MALTPQDQYRILKTLDNPPRILFWDLDDFLMLICPFFLGMLIGSVTCMLMSFLVKRLYSKAKKRYPKGSFKHKLYWHLPSEVFSRSGRFKNFPPSHLRELIL